jgi:predicted metalloprotease with PDZ domain
LTLLYPQWIPGEHGPTGPINDVVNLHFHAKDQTVAWHRDSTNLYAFHLNLPSGATTLEAAFDFISPTDVGGFSGGSSMTTELAVLSWNQYVLYPQGTVADQLRYQAKLRLPHDWHYGTALPVAKESGDEIEFRSVSLTTLVDSPVSTGAHYRTVDLGSVNGAPHYMHISADNERSLAITPDTIEHYRKLIAEAGALFGPRHYRSYHFLLTLSDHVASFGLEHHESSDDRLDERTLIDDILLRYHAELLPHEYVHSWNGKYRRPAGLATKNYDEPMRGDLLWIYEGLTEYLGSVLSARSGLQTADLFRDRLAYVASHLAFEAGRNWRPLADASISGQLLFDARTDYSSLRRGLDFYGEGQLVWLEVDTLLRKLTHGAKSIDDFCHVFYAGEPGPSVNPYTLDDVVAALNRVQPHDWAAFFRQRVDAVDPHAPVAGFENAGWKLTYNDKRSDYWSTTEDEEKTTDLMPSLGLRAKTEGVVEDVVIGGPVQKAGIAPGAKITSIDGRAFSPTVLREAAASDGPLEFMVRSGDHISTHKVDYHGGEKYPHLDRENNKPDLLSDIVRAKVP